MNIYYLSNACWNFSIFHKAYVLCAYEESNRLQRKLADNIAGVILYTEEEYMVSLYLFTNNFVLMSNLWKYYLYYICIAKKPINVRRVLDLLSFQVSLLNWAAHCHFQREFHCRSKADRICVLDIPRFQGYHQLWRRNSACKGKKYSAKCPVFLKENIKVQHLLLRNYSWVHFLFYF